VDEFPCISRIPGELYDVTVEALSTVSGEMLTQVHLKIIVAEKNQFAPKFERDSYTAEVGSDAVEIVAGVNAFNVFQSTSSN